MQRVTAGMPVLNAEATITRALQDLVAQTYRNIEIVVCDNASDDRTAEIAEAFARSDPRIRVIRFTNRVDIMHSFRRAFEACHGPYFMFAPADDRWYARFVEEAVAVLDARNEVVACCPRIAFTGGRRFLYLSAGTRALVGSHRARLRCYFAGPSDNARAFAVYRREALEGTFPETWFPGWDFVMIAATLAHGTHVELPAVLMERDRTPDEKYIAEFDRYFRGSWRRWLPLGPVASAVWRNPKTPFDIGLAWNLALFVVYSHQFYATNRSRRWSRFVNRFAQRVRLERWPVCAPEREGHDPSPTISGARPNAARSRRISSR